MSIRETPPDAIVTKEELLQYHTLHDDMVNNGVLLNTEDRHALAELAISLVEMGLCRVEIRANGMVMNTLSDRGVEITKPNPAVATLQKLQVHVKSMFKEFNMTPNSRGSKGNNSGAGAGESDDGYDKI